MVEVGKAADPATASREALEDEAKALQKRSACFQARSGNLKLLKKGD